ncbi:DUF2382 domain-containing protein (plasmid) [Deinococcus taeanensis]|uniref:PRC and DUF2382 domain-containing protein n=1 Tax=Deinococcus taeanensis TaxID=2737050 RepID=UPI001CDD5DE9|nr:DUF2382 domain-containing protein [Deinococcus taeanensis]UBV45054.1 DUF2382 domain-containing protein [Deinococcus taeanensis]
MARLIPISELVRDRNYDLGDTYNVIGHHAYGLNGERLGTIREALTDESGRIRYFIVDAGGWFTAKEVMVPVGLARIENDGVYFDSLTRDQVKDMSSYTADQTYDYDAQVADERVLRGVTHSEQQAGTTGEYRYREDDTMFQTPQRLQLLEERLQVNKDRYVAGQVQVGKHVETRTENVTVPLEREEIVIERRAVTEAQPVSGTVRLGEDTETMTVHLEAERADVSKQAFVTEEIEVGKRTITEQQTVTETVGREVLDVRQNGDVQVEGADMNRTGLMNDRMETTETTTTDVIDSRDGDRR